MLARRTWWTAAALAAVLVAVAVVLVVRHLGEDRLAPGFVASGSTGGLDELATVELPIGSVELTAGDPLHSVDARDIGRSSDGRVDVERGAVIIPVAWRFVFDLTGAEAAPYPADFSVSLDAGDDRYELGRTEPDLGITDLDDLLVGDTVLAVAPEGADLSVGVTYDGETQTVDLATGEIDAGRAAPLYDGPPPLLDVAPACDATRGDDLDRLVPAAGGGSRGSLYCDLEPLVQTAYQPLLGWADEGERWTEVTLVVNNTGDVALLGSTTRYRVRRGTPSLELDGASLADQTCTAPRRLQTCTAVFSGPPIKDRVALRVDAPLTGIERTPGPGPERLRFGVHQAFRLTA